MGSRCFVSYSHRSAEDSALADLLRAGLEQAGHEVFIDKGMRAGTDWVEEIAAGIAWCEYLIVLLSRKSVHSEMVLGEVRMAHRRRRRDRGPHILPIRVRYDGDLDYELDSYLARIQGTSKNESFGVKLGVLGDLRGPPSGSTAWFPRNSCPTGPIFFLQAPNPGRWAL